MLFKNFNVAVVDSPGAKTSKLVKILTKNFPLLSISYTGSCLNEMLKKNVDNNIQLLLFLDAQYQVKSGFDLDRLNAVIKKNIIILTSENQQNLSNSSQARVLTSLVKPFKKNRVIQVVLLALINFLQKNIEQVKTSTPSDSGLIGIPSTNSMEIIKVSSILYLQAEGRYTYFYLLDGVKKISVRNIGSYENILNSSFYRVHHSYIVNLAYANTLNKSDGSYLTLSTGQQIPVSNRKKKEFRAYLGMH